MPGKRPTTIDRALTAKQILESLPESPWSESQRIAIRGFTRVVANGNALEVVHRYLKLVGELGGDHGLGKALTITEGGRLLVTLDAHAYRGVPIDRVLVPVEWIQERTGTPTGRQRLEPKLERWIGDLPERLNALGAQLARGRASSALTFGYALNELVAAQGKLSSSKPPAVLEAACDAFRQGRTCVVEVPSAECFAFYWPQSLSSWPELLSGKQAERFVTSIGKPKSERSLRDLAKEHPALKRGSKFVRNELERAKDSGLLDHGNRKDG